MLASFALVKNYRNLKLPFFFDSIKNPLNRFESFIYNFEFNLEKRSYILYFYFGSKERVKILFSSFFYYFSLKKHTYVFYVRNLFYLFWNSLSKNLINIKNEKDYFKINPYKKNISIYSDLFYYLNYSFMKYDRVYFDNIFDVDVSISSGYFDNYQKRYFKIVDDFNPFTSFYLTAFDNSKFGLSSAYFSWCNKNKSYEKFRDKFLLIFSSFNAINKKFKYISYIDSYINTQIEEYFLLVNLPTGSILNNFIAIIFSELYFFDSKNFSFFFTKYKSFFKYFIYFFLELDMCFSFFHEKQEKVKKTLINILANIFRLKRKVRLMKKWRKKKIKTIRSNSYNIINKNYSLYYSNLLLLPAKIKFSIPKFKVNYFKLGSHFKNYSLYLTSKFYCFKSLFTKKNRNQLKMILNKYHFFLSNFNMLVFSIYKKDFLQSFFSVKSFNFEIYIRNFIYAFKLFFVNYKDIIKFFIKKFMKKIKAKKYKGNSKLYINKKWNHFTPFKYSKELCY